MEIADPTRSAVPRVRRLASVIQRGTAIGDSVFLDNIIDAVADPILVKDQNLRFVLVNQALCDFTGIARERFIGRTDAELFPAEEARVFNEMDRRVLETGQPNVNEEDHTHADGTVRTIRTTKTMFVDERGAKVLVGIFTDLTALRAAQRELETANRRLEELAHRDSLTALPNRMSFEHALAGAVAGAQRHGEVFSVLFMDLNGFKRINDSHGHAAGDMVLKGVAQTLAGGVRGDDLVARLGGEEFLVGISGADRSQALDLAERLRAAVAQQMHALPGQHAGPGLSCTISIGVSNAFHQRDQWEAALRDADAALYRSKQAGRNRVVAAGPDA